MITRLEIIDYTKEVPREVIVNPEDRKVITYSLQDDDKTLKVFINDLH